MEVKVCGMRETDNIRDLIQLPIDYIGFIFYKKSARYVELIPTLKDSKRFKNIKKVGVFVNAEIDFILNTIKKFNLNVIQLHGKETPQYLRDLKLNCKRINLPTIEFWKVFSIDDSFDFNETKPYEQLADKFLFDTKTPQHGGSGQKFNWDLLNNYTGQTPFFLSGGISIADTEGVKNVQHPQFWGLDVNSKFEITPALKDIQMLHSFLDTLGLL
ncbi:MAG: phosphoribosylanthranilate isomerase [Saprospiraceae bacterium]|nr:phosphoribosylanthranilate isomerase [Saprospiraceae bacterium]